MSEYGDYVRIDGNWNVQVRDESGWFVLDVCTSSGMAHRQALDAKAAIDFARLEVVRELKEWMIATVPKYYELLAKLDEIEGRTDRSEDGNDTPTS